MATPDYKIRLMYKKDIPQVLNIWRETGYHEGTHTLYSWLEVDPEGFYVAVTDTDEVLGVCCAILHHEDLAFVGIYCVRKQYRGQGIGRQVWSACNEHIGTRNAALTAVPDKIELYRDTCGYPFLENEWVGLEYATTESLNVDLLSEDLPPEVELQPYKAAFLPLMSEYYFRLMGYRLDEGIRLSSEETDSSTYVAIKDGACVGFGSIKTSCQGAGQVGPVYADDHIVAEVMFKKLILSLPRVKGFDITTCSSNYSANEIVQRLGWPFLGSFPRLYRKKVLKVDAQKVFAQFAPNFAPF